MYSEAVHADGCRDPTPIPSRTREDQRLSAAITTLLLGLSEPADVADDTDLLYRRSSIVVTMLQSFMRKMTWSTEDAEEAVTATVQPESTLQNVTQTAADQAEARSPTAVPSAPDAVSPVTDSEQTYCVAEQTVPDIVASQPMLSLPSSVSESSENQVVLPSSESEQTFPVSASVTE